MLANKLNQIDVKRLIIKLIAAFIICIMSAFTLFGTSAKAASETDEITNYTITVDVNPDATLNIRYHIDWLVLESDSAGPVSWVEVGIPNSHAESLTALSKTIKDIDFKKSGGTFAKITFDKSYYEGETVSFDFSIVQDYMYEVDKYELGHSVYSFTPGWFDDIRVDEFVLRWNCDNAEDWSPSCTVEDGYCTWRASLGKGEKYPVTVTYANDSYGFDTSKCIDEEESSSSTGDDIIEVIAGIIAVMIMLFMFFGLPIIIISKIVYAIRRGFGLDCDKKITRTKIVYYPVCPGCGAVRGDGQTTCEYCGRSFIKSEEVIKDDRVSDADKEALNYKSKGEYHYSSDPNVFVRVNVVRVPRPAASRSGGRSSGGSHHSSCAHSSCACACACACAGGGRAGCTNKDFYNTGLKLKAIERKTKQGKAASKNDNKK